MTDKLPAQSDSKHKKKPQGVEVKVVNDGAAIGIILPDGPRSMIEIFGTENEETGLLLFNQMLGAMNRNGGIEGIAKRGAAMIPVLKAINPQDELEGLLATQMIGIHCMAMEVMSNGMKNSISTEKVNSCISQLTKLTRTFTAQIEALNRHRGKGQQKMTVEHVHVNEGGKAVIGNVDQGGGRGK